MTQEALKHLKAITEAFGPDAGIELDQKAWAKLHTAIKEALAQPEQEPVAWRDKTYGTLMNQEWQDSDPLYIRPPQRTFVGLTDEQIDACWNKDLWKEKQPHHIFAKAIEAKLKELNT